MSEVSNFPPNGHNENAIDLTLPASDALLKNRQTSWVQLAGHKGVFAPASPRTIWKKRLFNDPTESKAYAGLMNDSCSDIIPTFYQEVNYNGEVFIEIENLIHHFNQPALMDIKMGYRTYQEKEVKNPVPRKDFYQKMLELNPSVLTESEHQQRGITKHRYMQIRNKESTTSAFGFRLEAIKMPGTELVKDCFRTVKESDEAVSYMKSYLQGNKTVHTQFLSRLKYIRQKIEMSDFFKNHEIIGSSLLFLYDSSNQASIWMIDFAKTTLIEGMQLDHRSPWQLGNHEDGYLLGLDNLINLFETISFD